MFVFFENFIFQVSEETNISVANELSNLRSEFEKCFGERDEIRNEKMMLENECSDLKEKLENLLKDFGNLKSEMQNKESNEQNVAKEAIEVIFKIPFSYFVNYFLYVKFCISRKQLCML